MAERLHQYEVRHFHLECGLGGGAKGFNDARPRFKNAEARFRCIGGIDIDPAALADFEARVGVPGTLIDLFSYDQYVEFHGHEPPEGWREATPDDIRRAAGYERPHIVFGSPPCKGFSGLLAEETSKTSRYQALNSLATRGFWLTLEAWADDPPEFFIFENVPRIMSRGRPMIDGLTWLFNRYNYLTVETVHDCGEIGGLAQSRKRFLYIARHREKVPSFLYQPPKRRLRGVGEILDQLPLPGDIERGGPMHRVPSLQWKTWVRLAFVPAGKDWRALNDLRVENGVLADFGIASASRWRGGILGVLPWSGASGVITGSAEPYAGRFSVADPRALSSREGSGFLGVRNWGQSAQLVTGNGRPGSGPHSVADPRPTDYKDRPLYGVCRWSGFSATVTSARSPGQGQFSVADPRIPSGRATVYGVRAWGAAVGVVAGESFPTNGSYAVADPRIDGHHKSVQMGVLRYTESAGVVTAAMYVGGGAHSVADPRITGGPIFNRSFRIVAFAAASPAISGPGGAAGGLGVADPRAPAGRHVNGKFRVTPYERPANSVIAASTTGNGAFVVADPKLTWGAASHRNKLKVTDYGATAFCITTSDRVGSGAQSVADPRPAGLARPDHYGVVRWPQCAPLVTGSAHGWDNGRFSVADPRPGCLQGRGPNDYGNGGHYGVVDWGASSWAIPAHAKNNNGPWSVADPRDSVEAPSADKLPAPDDRLVCVIIAQDGTWHRPFTTLELAALQSLFEPDDLKERPFVLFGQSDSAWRERIGNAVPSEAAEAVGEVMGRTLLMVWTGETFTLSADPIWVRPQTALEIALSVDIPELPL